MDKSVPMGDNIREKFFDEETLSARIAEVGAQITADYKDKQNEGITVLSILRGGVIFMCDLVKKIDLTLSIDFMSASSYGNSAKSSGHVEIETLSSSNFNGRHIIIAEDIVDTGLTLKSIVEFLYDKGAKTVVIAAMLDKHKSEADLPLKYVCFDCPNEFIVGYGLDFMQDYRNLPYIGVMKDDIFKEMEE